MGDLFNAHKADSKARRADNRASSAAVLRASGIEFQERNDGAHLIVQGRVDFWPGTGLYKVRPNGPSGRGVRNLRRWIASNPTTQGQP